MLTLIYLINPFVSSSDFTGVSCKHRTSESQAKQSKSQIKEEEEEEERGDEGKEEDEDEYGGTLSGGMW